MNRYELKLILIFLLFFVLASHCAFIMHIRMMKFDRYSSKEKVFDLDIKEPYIKNWKTSIAFYVILGSTLKFPPEQDLRGKFWEPQLKYFDHNYSVYYISDGKMNISGIDVQILPKDLLPNWDVRLCKRTHATWKHFLETNPHTKWYYRGTHDSYVRMKNLEKMLKEFEAKLDPMKEWGMAFGCHEYDAKIYPQGGTGYLFSHYAVEQFVKEGERFMTECDSKADDLEMGPFIESFGLRQEDFVSNKFIVTFPFSYLDIIKEKKFYKAQKCPEYYYLFNGAPGFKPCPIDEAVSIHMHHVPMNEVDYLLENCPKEIYVTYTRPDRPVFCNITK